MPTTKANRILLPILTTAALALPACTSPQPISLHVSDSSGTPIHGATISAVPIQTSLIPLPLSSDTLTEVLTADAQRLFVVTDPQGNATLRILEKPHALSVSLPAFTSAQADERTPPWLFTLDPQSRQLLPPRDRTNPPGLSVTTNP